MKDISYTARRRDNFGAVGRRGNTSAGVTRRMGAAGLGATMSTSWARGHNTVRHIPKTLGTMSLSAIMGMLVLIVGLIYVTQGTRAAGMDYELSSIENEIDDLTMRKEDLAVEKARMTAIAAVENSTVTAAMEDGPVQGYARE